MKKRRDPNMTNPVLTRNTTALRGTGATVQGIALITLLYLGFVVSAAMMAWQHPEMFAPRIIVLSFAGLGVGLLVSYYPKWANVLGPVYAILEGFLIGVYSMLLETRYPGIVMEAATCTFGIAFACAVLYGSGLVKVTDKFMKIVFTLTAGIATIYLIDLVAWFAFDTNVPLLHENSKAGIIVSFIIICIATMRLFADYEMVTRAVEMGVDAKYEPYYAFALTVTLIWLYLEILRLMGKSRSRK